MDAKLKKNTKLTIGRLAEAAGVSIPTVRYYQRRGLMAQPQRPGSGGFREYGDDDLVRLLFIKRAQELGFTLAEVLELLDHVGNRNCEAIALLAKSKLREIKARIALLKNVRKSLEMLIEECPDGCSPDACPFVGRLFACESRKP
jgi:MerR family mercuric resistance operon transcriptional regulator